MNRLAILAAAGLGLTLAACDSQAENEVEEQATAIDESYEAEAAVVESLTENTPEEETGEVQAEALREQGEDVKDDLEDAADEMDPEPQ